VKSKIAAIRGDECPMSSGADTPELVWVGISNSVYSILTVSLRMRGFGGVPLPFSSSFLPSLPLEVGP